MMKMIWRNLGTLAAVRFADVKEVDPAVECKAHLSIKLVMMTMIITMMIDGLPAYSHQSYSHHDRYDDDDDDNIDDHNDDDDNDDNVKQTNSSLSSQSSLLKAFKLPRPMFDTCP